MPRRARFTVEDGIYHVMVRGNNRNAIFHYNEDFELFLELLKENKEKYELKIYHYILMDNHVHMILRAPDGKRLSEAIKRINVTYTRYYRKKYKGIGHFFQDRFKSFLIQEGIHLVECGRYVELNPVSAGMVKEPGEYRWTSYRVYADGERDGIVDTDPEYERLSENKERRKQIYRDFVKDGILERRDEERFFKEGAYGSKGFVKAMKEKGLKSVWSHGGRPKKKKIE